MYCNSICAFNFDHWPYLSHNPKAGDGITSRTSLPTAPRIYINLHTVFLCVVVKSHAHITFQSKREQTAAPRTRAVLKRAWWSTAPRIIVKCALRSYPIQRTNEYVYTWCSVNLASARKEVFCIKMRWWCAHQLLRVWLCVLDWCEGCVLL